MTRAPLDGSRPPTLPVTPQGGRELGYGQPTTWRTSG